MLSALFKSSAPLPEESIHWLFDGFNWALQNFGSDAFFNETRLIEPTREYFPGKGDNVDEMAQLVFKHALDYCGLGHWPCRVMNHHEFDDEIDSLPSLPQVLKQCNEGQTAALTVFFEPAQVANPDAMIANYVHSLAHHISALAEQPAPCDVEQWPHMMELVAVYLGFGIMFANTAVPKRIVGCGTCHNPAQDRQGAMTEMEVLYALAIFCVLKDISPQQVNQHIKAYLKPLLKKAIKDVKTRTDALAALRAIDSPSKVRGKQIGSI